MTLEELKLYTGTPDPIEFPLGALLPEILALVEAINRDFDDPSDDHMWDVSKARDAFNSKLEAL